MKFNNHVAVVAGASSGIGKSLAISLAAEGASLYLIGRNQKKLAAVIDGIKGSSRIIACQADLTHSDDINRVCHDVQKQFGRVDILLHSIGAIALGAMDSASLRDFDMQFAANVRSPYELTSRLLPLIVSSRGQIVFINSSAGVQNGRANMGQYAASKHALKVIADSLRDEINSKGVRVLSVYPGRTATPMQAMIHQVEEKDYRPESLLQPEDVAAMVLSALSLPRTAEVTDIHIRPMQKGH